MYMLSDRRGVPQGRVQANMWLNIAASRMGADDPLRKQALKFRDELETEMTPHEIAEAERLAREWMKQYCQ
jgi:hypothetical protein